MQEMLTTEEKLMRMAIRLAREAFKLGEVPIGCVIEKDGEIIGKGKNLTIKEKDATKHAEIIAIGQAGRKLSDFRLDGSRLFVTVEPCVMCLGAILLARIREVHFGIHDPKFGALSRFSLKNHERLRKLVFFGGYFKEEIQDLMSSFFARMREKGQ